MLYETHLHPFLHAHERTIDDFITTSHDRLRASSLSSVLALLALLKTYLLGAPPQQADAAPAEPPSQPMSYAHSLLARFNLPTTAPAPASSSSHTDFYALLASAVAAATSASSSSPSASATAPSLVPPSMRGPERASFISAQRERLTFLLSALDREAEAPRDEVPRDGVSRGGVADNGGGGEPLRQRHVSGAGLPKSRSEADFEKIDVQEAREEGPGRRGSGWMPWS